jgi:hypothetical protein
MKIKSSPLRACLLLVAVSSPGIRVYSQGTVQVGFEEFPTGVTPPFVTRVDGLRAPSVKASGVTPAFDGQNYLDANGTISIASPDGQPIQSFTLHLFFPSDLAGTQLDFRLGSLQPTITAFGSWQTFQETFTVPVQSVGISTYVSIGERFPENFAVDGIEFVTIPEPQTIALFLLGLGAIFFNPNIRNSWIKQK